ncbi:hypothetical protein SAMD00019534_036170, partial [Acytostelium subglobosum LB1]|uniref:hypothetical protein n=1 Tax=Acytostelium subglobosum LB1 TaxID=1410327 RepID=UPI000644F40E
MTSKEQQDYNNHNHSNNNDNKDTSRMDSDMMMMAATLPIMSPNVESERINQLLTEAIRMIFSQVEELKNKMSANQSKSNELLNQSLRNLNAKDERITQLKQRPAEPQQPVIPNKEDKATDDGDETQTTDSNKEQQQQQLEEYYQKIVRYEEEVKELNEKVDSLQKIVLMFQRSNNKLTADYAEVTTSLEHLVAKGRAQTQTLMMERNHLEQYRLQLSEQQNANQRLRQENTQLKIKMKEMLTLLQCAAEEDDPNQQLVSQLLTENAALRKMLHISQSFAGNNTPIDTLLLDQQDQHQQEQEQEQGPEQSQSHDGQDEETSEHNS